VSQSISLTTKDYVVHVQDLNGIGMTKTLSLPTMIALCSVSLNKPILPSLVILGDITIGGSMIKVDNLANCLQVAKDAGAKKVLVPMTSAVDIGTVPPELMGTFNLIFYQTPEDAVFKALGVE
ncbi:MAG: S16 family serine protease, partial [Enterococcus sp.]|uniref:S16 family serine protease n=1 Tax=Enterococcus sp. TaxID=35783 RepID=UPI002FCC5316